MCACICVNSSGPTIGNQTACLTARAVHLENLLDRTKDVSTNTHAYAHTVFSQILQLQDSNSGIQSMQTQGLGLTTNYQWINNTQEFTGYKSSIQLVSIVKNSAV